MSVRFLTAAFVCASSVYAQKFNWQNYCFDHQASPVCQGNDYAIKPTPAPAPSRDVIRNPFPATPRAPSASRVTKAPTMLVLSKIDWRFADPFADGLIGFNFEGLQASSLARAIIFQMGTQQGLKPADVEKIFTGLSGVDQVGISIHGGRVVVMATGSAATSSFPPSEADMKTLMLSGDSMLAGHADAVDQAQRRIQGSFPMSELAQLAEQRQATAEFWAIGTPGFVGGQAAMRGLKRFYLTVSLRDRLVSDLAFEFYAAPNTTALRAWQTQLGTATLEGNTVHVRTSMSQEEALQKFDEIASSAVGQKLAALIVAAKDIPTRQETGPKRTKPVIYGLDDAPREVGTR